MFDRLEKGLYWDRSWKLVEGCTPVSSGCDHCWSARETHRMANHPNQSISGPKKDLCDSLHFNGLINLRYDNIKIPYKVKGPSVWAVWNDLFHEDVPECFIDLVLEIISACPQHIFLALTKRPENIQSKIYGMGSEFPVRELAGGDYLPNLWIGVTAENQDQADKRIPILFQIPAAKRFVSCEPLLSEIDLDLYLSEDPDINPSMSLLDWIIAGGESGPETRPTHPDWVRSLRDQCQEAEVPFVFKQWGEWLPVGQEPVSEFKPIGKKDAAERFYLWKDPDENVSMRIGRKAAGRILDRRTWDEVPNHKQDSI